MNGEERGKKQNGAFHTVRGYQMHKLQDGTGLTPALEDYLEMVFWRIQEDGSVRAGALSDWLCVKPSSVTKMLYRLNKLGFIHYYRYGEIRLTEQGEAAGKYLLWRHDTVFEFLSILYDGEERDFLEEAELLEHCLSAETVLRLKRVNDRFK